MRYVLFFGVFALLCASFVYMYSPQKVQGTGGAVQFSWSAFQRFWNKNTTPLVLLRNPQKVDDGYVVDYGDTTTLHIVVEDKTVTAVIIRFMGGKGHDAGGRKFTRLVRHAIDIGSYRWPPEIVQEAQKHFSVMANEKRDFHYQRTFFHSEYNPDAGWEFRMEYIF